MQELTFNIDDRREIKPPTSVENFHLTFGNQPGADLPGDNWVQGRQNADSLRQVFVNIRQGSNNMPYNVTGFILQFAGRTAVHSDGKSYRIIDNSSVVVDGANGRMRFTFPAAAFAVAGTYKQAYFRLIREADYKCVATLEFDLSVVQDFVFNDIMPSDWVDPFNDVRKQLQQSLADFQAQSQSDLADTKKQLQTMFDQASQRVSDTVEQMTSLGATVKEGLQTAQTALEALQLKIQQDGLFTQAEAEAFKQVIEQEIDKLRNSAVTVFDTETDLMQANLNSGLTVRTLGCTAAADGLGAIYKIVNEQPASGYSIKLANGKYAMLVSVDTFRKTHMIYQAGQVGELSDQRSLKTTNLVTNHGITVSRNTKGSGQDATVASIIANTQDPTSAVLGVDTPKIFKYKNLDSVALYVANGTDNPHITIQKGTYATTKNEFILNEDIEGIEPGMYIALTSVETTHSKLKVSDIAYLAQILTVSGRTLTVDGYYSKDSDEPLDAGPSPSTYTAYINPITKRWGINPVVEIGADDRPSGAVIEGDVKNHNASEAPDDLGVFDAVNLKEGKANYAFRAHTNSYSNPFDNGVDLTNTLNLLKGYGTPQSFQKIITAERTDKDIPFIMDYDGAVSYEALIPTKEQQANWASFQVQDAGASYTLKNAHNGQYLTLAIGTAGDFSLLVDEQNVQSIDYNDANTPRHGLKMTFQRANGGYMLFRIFVYQNRAYIMSMVNGKFISAEGS